MQQLFHTIPKVVGELDRNENADKALVFAAWKRSAGRDIALRATPVAFDANKLKIAVADPSWAEHLRSMSPVLLAKVNALLDGPSVRFIEFVVEVAKPERADDPTGNDVVELNVEQSVYDAALGIPDEGLREQFLILASLRNK